MKQVNDYKELLNAIGNRERSLLLLYKSSGSEQNNCALKSLTEAASTFPNTKLLTADVASAKDIHPQFAINTVPILVEFKKDKLINTFKGCHHADFYRNIINGNSVNIAANQSNQAPQKQVIVYSTPTCSWCNTLKNYFNDHGIKYRDIDVSKDQAAAKDMVKRSGQQGVPQTLINNEIIVGFDKARINQLLHIKNK